MPLSCVAMTPARVIPLPIFSYPAPVVILRRSRLRYPSENLIDATVVARPAKVKLARG